MCCKKFEDEIKLKIHSQIKLPLSLARKFIIKHFFSSFWVKIFKPPVLRVTITVSYNIVACKGQLNSEWIYEVIVSPKMPTKNYKDFCPTKQTRIVALFFGDFLVIVGSLFGYDPCLSGRAEILLISGLHFGRKDDLINSFWI